jgi:N-acetylglutamate synthase-like GNAT family acetyltransferase
MWHADGSTLYRDRTGREQFVLRPHRPGDLGWVIHRHGVLYFAEHGWDERHEGAVARTVADFVATFDAARERCWIAERDDAIVGSVFCVAQEDEIAELRLLLVEPSARGRGLGARLVDDGIAFASARLYRKVRLWTSEVHVMARHIFERRRFRLVEQKPMDAYRRSMAQCWELDLGRDMPRHLVCPSEIRLSAAGELRAPH